MFKICEGSKEEITSLEQQNIANIFGRLTVEIFKSNSHTNITAGWIDDLPATWPGVDTEPESLDQVTWLKDSDSFEDAGGWTYYVHDEDFMDPIKSTRIKVHQLTSDEQIKELEPGDRFCIPHSPDSYVSRFVGLTPDGQPWILRGWRNTMARFAQMKVQLANLWDDFKAKAKSNRLKLKVIPVTLKAAKEFVSAKHRHHQAPQGHKFSIGVQDEEGKLRGVIIVGRPVARTLDDGLTCEATRVCTDGAANACSILYAAAWKAARAMGYEKMITYTLKEENGASLKASNFFPVHITKGQSWSRSNRQRQDKHPTTDKIRWQIGANARSEAILL